MYLSFEADWIPFRRSLSFFDLLLFHSVNNHLPMKLATLPSVCVCVCVCVRVREREREIERRCIFGHVFALVPTDKIGFVSQKYVSERESLIKNESKQTQTILRPEGVFVHT